MEVMVGDVEVALRCSINGMRSQPSAQAGLVFAGEFSGAPNP